jgi:hypothetical protein
MTDPTADLRRTIYLLLGAAAVAVCVAKVIGAENVFEPSRYDTAVRKWPATRPTPTPMYSSNDRSRWATVRALVEQGEYVVGRRDNFTAKDPPFADRGIIFEDGYQSLDKVMNPATGEFYSSKPPLFATLVAGEYWVLNKLFGWTLTTDRWPVVIVVLLTVNVLPFAVYLWLLAKLIDGYGTTDFGRVFAFAVAAFGTYLTTFSATLNNHTPAAYCVLFAVYLLMSVERPTLGRLAAAGFFAGFAATFELPALAVVVGLFVPLAVVRPGRSVGFLAGAAVPLAALAACNVAALGTLRPAYTEFGGPWYEYGGSHWLKLKDPVRPPGIDFNQEPPPVYAFHLTLGHHGWFSLTPAWLLGVVGVVLSVKPGLAQLRNVFTRQPGPVWTPPLLAGLTAAVTVVLLGFYLTRTQSYNYGGYTSGLRWLFWLTPLWLLATVRGADAVAGRRGLRWVAAGLLGLSVVSVFYPAWNPWRFPWVQQFLEHYGWVRY